MDTHASWLPQVDLCGNCESLRSKVRDDSGEPMILIAWVIRTVLSKTGFYTALVILAVLLLVSVNNAHVSVASPEDVKPRELSQSSKKGTVFSKKPLVLWTTDFHIATIGDIRDLMEPMGVTFIDRSLTSRCRFHGNCANDTNLKVVTSKNGMRLDPALIGKFYEAYKDDPLMKRVDAFVCFHPTAMCQLYKPFNKSLIIMSSTRFELGRFEADRWQQWIDDLKDIAADPKNFIGANNEYDSHYIAYFTGLQVPVIPSFCGYTGATYNPIRPGFLTFAGRNPPSFYHIFFREAYNATWIRRNLPDDLRFQHFRSVYEKFEYQDLANHQGVIFVPYQLSIMTIFELHRMNIPLFFPSLRLLCQWQFDHLVVKERTFHTFFHKNRSQGSILPPHPSQTHVPDPNDDFDMESIKYWFRFADFYATLPHIVYFESVDDLFDKLQSTDLRSVSERMKVFNEISRRDISEKWKKVLRNVAEHSRNRPL